VKQALASLDRAPATAIGNMKDILAGRPSEMETEIGAVVRLAETSVLRGALRSPGLAHSMG